MSTTQITIRLPDEMLDMLKTRAANQRRSLAAQIAFEVDRANLSSHDTRSPIEQDAYTEGLAMRRGEKR